MNLLTFVAVVPAKCRRATCRRAARSKTIAAPPTSGAMIIGKSIAVSTASKLDLCDPSSCNEDFSAPYISPLRVANQFTAAGPSCESRARNCVSGGQSGSIPVGHLGSAGSTISSTENAISSDSNSSFSLRTSGLSPPVHSIALRTPGTSPRFSGRAVVDSQPSPGRIPPLVPPPLPPPPPPLKSGRLTIGGTQSGGGYPGGASGLTGGGTIGPGLMPGGA
jgi:hypothetical protein